MRRKDLNEAIEIMEEGRFWRSRLLLSAVELDIFTLLDKRAMKAGEISTQRKMNPRATKIFLDAMCGQGFLLKKKNLYENAPRSSKYLVEGKPLYLGDILKHNSNLWQRWGKLTEVVQKGKPARKPRSKRTKKETRDFVKKCNDDIKNGSCVIMQ